MALTTSEALGQARTEVQGLRTAVVTMDAAAAGPVPRFRFPRLATTLSAGNIRLGEFEVVGGIQQYARDQLDDQTYDVVARFAEVRLELGTLIAWIVANYPTSPTGFLLTYTFEANGMQISPDFIAADLTGFRTQAQLFIAACDAFLP